MIRRFNGQPSERELVCGSDGLQSFGQTRKEEVGGRHFWRWSIFCSRGGFCGRVSDWQWAWSGGSVKTLDVESTFKVIFFPQSTSNKFWIFTYSWKHVCLKYWYFPVITFFFKNPVHIFESSKLNNFTFKNWTKFFSIFKSQFSFIKLNTNLKSIKNLLKS